MKMSKSAKRMAKRHARGKKVPSMNLVSLMDIFTILVFFLLVSQAESDALPEDDKMKLPVSISESKPAQTVTVMVTRDRIMVQGAEVANLEAVAQLEEKIITTVKSALQKELDKVLVKDVGANKDLLEVTILADKSIPFSILKKVMNTCTELGYTKISLAVVQKSAKAQS
jgi:biopolymer transport protein ExbD